jgi:UDPglucose 6-dehydrogenase
VHLGLLEAVHAVNQRQPSLLLDAARSHFGGTLAGRTFAVWGLAFKPRTDDIREAPALRVIDEMLESGASVRVHDPKALRNARAVYDKKLAYCEDSYDALTGADALFICTEWNEFRSPDFDRIRAALGQPVIFDGRNVYSLDQMKRHGFHYYSIGRPPLHPA